MNHAQRCTEHLMIGTQDMTNSATVSARLDTIGADYATIRVNLASEINTNAVGPTLSLLHSDDTVVTNFVTVVANRTAEDITAAKTVTYHVDLKGKKRYLRLTVTTATATNDNVTVSATGTLSRKEAAPASTSAMAGTTNDVVVLT